MRTSRHLAALSVCACLLVTSCASGSDVSRSAMSVETETASPESHAEASECPANDTFGADVDLSKVGDTVTMKVCELAVFGKMGDEGYVYRSSNPDVAQVSDAEYVDTEGNSTVVENGGGVMAVHTGEAQITVAGVDAPTDPIKTMRVIIER